MLGKVAVFRKRLLDWYALHRRDLPWRVKLDAPAGTRPSAYHVLVSEAMLQQTQVTTVIPYFLRFIERLPTLKALADAEGQEVLRLWQGLGYYSRARNLHKAAQVVVESFCGELPAEPARLLELPGVGRYTAGAIASIAFDQRAPILDGNVMRVLCRLGAVRDDPRSPRVREELWTRARQVLPRRRCGDFNSALMELGATVCTPRSPRCPACPVRLHCAAVAAGIQEEIPPPKRAVEKPVERRWTFCVRHGDRWLVEQRPARGRWAQMWQFVTLEALNGSPTHLQVRQAAGVRTGSPRKIGHVSHGLTHRQYEVEVFLARATARPSKPDPSGARRWATLAELEELAVTGPHVRIARMLREV